MPSISHALADWERDMRRLEAATGFASSMSSFSKATMVAEDEVRGSVDSVDVVVPGQC